MDRKVKMPLVGPFEITDEEFLGMKILWQEDEKQLRATKTCTPPGSAI